jgi:hypothetical protein
MWEFDVRPTLFAKLLLTTILSAALAGCIIGRVYRGSPVQGDPEIEIRAGVTDRADVLRVFGAPDRIVSRPEGDVFIYRFVRENSKQLLIEEPVITNLTIFSYSVSETKEDRLVILFDSEGKAETYGYLKGTQDFDR